MVEHGLKERAPRPRIPARSAIAQPTETRPKMSRIASLLVLACALCPVTARAQVSNSDLLTRIDRLEAALRELTGTVEQLQYRNREIEQQLQRLQAAAPAAAPASRSAAQAAIAPPPAQYSPPPPAPYSPSTSQAAPIAPPSRNGRASPMGRRFLQPRCSRRCGEGSPTATAAS